MHEKLVMVNVVAMKAAPMRAAATLLSVQEAEQVPTLETECMSDEVQRVDSARTRPGS